MVAVAEKKIFTKILVLGAATVSLIITPYLSYEVITPGKFLILGMLGGVCLGILPHTFKKKSIPKMTLIINSIFLFALFASLMANRSNYFSQIYGVDGRRNGIVTYLILSLLFLCSAQSSSSFSITYFKKIFIVTSGLITAYALLQVINMDPFPWDRNIKWISSTFGNPNFLASFLAMACIPIILNFNIKFYLVNILLCVNLYIMYQTKSYQGFLSLFLALNLIFLIYILKQNIRISIKIGSMAITLAAFAFLILDLTQSAPWRSILYKDSLSTRFDYWRAALRIFKDHPFFGIGMDQFGNFYGRYRDLNAALNIEGAISTDSVHNIYLDILVGGGLFLLIPYLCLIVLTFREIYKTISKFEEIDFLYMSLVGIWVVFLIQSMISINHLGLAVWGWISMGILINYSSEENADFFVKKIDQRVGRQTHLVQKKFLTFKLIIGGILGGIVAFPIWNIDRELYVAYKEKNLDKLIAVGYVWPQDPRRMSRIAETLIEIGSMEEAKRMLTKASEIEPDSDVPLKAMLDLTNLGAPERRLILIRILELDPYFEQAAKIN